MDLLYLLGKHLPLTHILNPCLKWKVLVSLAAQLCHVMFFWKLSYVEGFCRGHVVFFWKLTGKRACVLLEQILKRTHVTREAEVCATTAWQELFLNRPTSLLCPVNLSSPSSGGGLEGRLKCVRNLIKVSFEKSKPEKLIFSPVPQDQDSAGFVAHL